MPRALDVPIVATRRTLPTLYVQVGLLSEVPTPTVVDVGPPPVISERIEGTLKTARRTMSAPIMP